MGKPDETIPGSFHSMSESKYAPMLVTGSYVGWLMKIDGKYLQARRLSEINMNPYLTPEKGLEAVYKYAEYFGEPITNDAAVLINELCMSDPFFISCVIQSKCGNKNLTTEEGIAETLNYEITNRRSEMSITWGEYIQITLDKMNDKHGKDILFHLSKYPDRYWTPKELRDRLGLEISTDEIRKRLNLLVEANLIEWGSSDIQFRGIRDRTLNLILRSRFEKEIKTFAPDLRNEFREEIRRLEKERGYAGTLSGERNRDG
ncbi:MAG: hypothetical protein GY749_15455 [Desulfobacteraceae bacterium]|nr:hypothetical protein [Desulfobacteraceae bacterium]